MELLRGVTEIIWREKSSGWLGWDQFGCWNQLLGEGGKTLGALNCWSPFVEGGWLLGFGNWLMRRLNCLWVDCCHCSSYRQHLIPCRFLDVTEITEKFRDWELVRKEKGCVADIYGKKPGWSSSFPSPQLGTLQPLHRHPHYSRGR